MKLGLLFLLSSWALGALPIEKFTAHPMACRTCHEKQYDFWEGTKHASAYVILYVKGQHFDPECIGCHTLGFRQPGGFQRVKESVVGKIGAIDLLKDLDKKEKDFGKLQKDYLDNVHTYEKEGKIEKLYQDVQCEHCHGLRGAHPGGEKSKKVSTTQCRICHLPDRSPHFSDSWIKKVACPLISAK